MNPRYYKWLVVAGIAGLLLAVAAGGLLLSKPVEQAKEAAPDFSLVLLKGDRFRFADHKGKPVLINFFASWCLPCREEMPVLEKIVRAYRPKGVVFLGIAIDDTEDKIQDFTRRYGVSFPVGLDQSGAVQKSFGLYGVPTTYFIDRAGIINYFHSGGVTEELLQHEIDKLL